MNSIVEISLYDVQHVEQYYVTVVVVVVVVVVVKFFNKTLSNAK